MAIKKPLKSQWFIKKVYVLFYCMLPTAWAGGTLLPSLRDPDGAASISKVINCYESECVSLPVVSDSATPWTVALQAPLSMGFPRREYLEWVVIPFSKGSS